MSQTKRHLETETEKRCTCGAGCCLDSDEHDCGCEAVEYLVEVGL